MSKKAKKIKKVANPYTKEIWLYGAITVFAVVMYLFARAGMLSVLNWPNAYLIIILTIGYAATNAYGQYRNFKKYRALCPDRVYDRKSFEQFMEQARYRKEMSNQLRK